MTLRKSKPRTKSARFAKFRNTEGGQFKPFLCLVNEVTKPWAASEHLLPCKVNLNSVGGSKHLLTSTQSDGCLVSSTFQRHLNVKSGPVEVDLAKTAKKLL
jgi:hypothetical protein